MASACRCPLIRSICDQAESRKRRSARREVDPVEGALDEVAVVGGRAADLGDVVRAERHILVDHAGPCDDRGKGEEVVGGDLVAAAP